LCLFWSSRKVWLKITIFAIHSPFLLPPFFRREEKSGNNNQSRDFKSCLSALSLNIMAIKNQYYTRVYPSQMLNVLVKLFSFIYFPFLSIKPSTTFFLNLKLYLQIYFVLFILIYIIYIDNQTIPHTLPSIN